jgi:DNA mismatch repair ATPase MutS
LILKFSERKQIFNVIKLIEKNKKTKLVDNEASKQQKKETIQDRILDKIRECNAKIIADHDNFIAAGCVNNEPKLIGYLTDLNIPSTRIKEVSKPLVRLLEEIQPVISHSDADLEEGYSNYTRKQIKSQAAWLTTAIEQINSYGAVKSMNRKPKAKKQVSPAKVVKSLKYLKVSPELNLTSVDPVNILKSSEIWVYDTKKRKLGIYCADSATSSLSVKGSKIIGFDLNTSVSKTMRKPETQLAEVMKFGKPASKKWFEEIRSTKAPLSGRITVDHLILKVYK